MKIIGITGPSGSGKSTAGRFFLSRGAEILDADITAREVVLPESDAIKEIKNEWSSVVVNGELDRKALAKIVFSDKEQLHKLNAITHKYIIKKIKEAIAKSSADIFVIDAIALFESGLSDLCDVTVSVIADKKTRISRIMERDNLTQQEAEMRINAQKDDSYYEKHADFVIYNDDEQSALEKKIGQIIGE